MFTLIIFSFEFLIIFVDDKDYSGVGNTGSWIAFDPSELCHNDNNDDNGNIQHRQKVCRLLLAREVETIKLWSTVLTTYTTIFNETLWSYVLDL